MSALHLYNAPGCPFAQRTRLVLREKGLDYTQTDIDLEDTPAWYLELSPTGKVPLLRHGDTLLWESTIINEYLEEVFPAARLMPHDPAERAWLRIWVDYANTQFLPWFYKLLLEQDPQHQAEHADTLNARLDALEQDALAHTAGPYFLGEQASLADIAFYPFFERLPVLAHYRGFPLPEARREQLPRLNRWLEAMRARPAVQIEAGDTAFYIRSYARYADNSADGSTAQEMREA